MMDRGHGSPPQTVLIVRLGAIGDVLMLLPAVHRLHRQGARVDWVCGKVVSPLLAMYPWIHRIEVDEQMLFHGGKAAQARALLGLWRKLAGRRYDLCATLQYDRRYAALARVVRAHRRIQLDKEVRGQSLVDGRWHANEYARVLGLTPDEYHEENVCLVRPDAVPAQTLLPTRTDRRRIGFVPAGARNILREGALRRWPIANYVAFAQQLLDGGDEVVLTGSIDDAWVREPFAPMLNHSNLRDCIGKTTLPELLAVYDTCDAVVTHDTGSLHIAAISKARVIAIFGPTTMGNFLPRRDGIVGLWGGERLPCRPCYDGREFAACPRNVCMEDVAVARVAQELEKLLGLEQDAASATALGHDNFAAMPETGQ